MDASKEHKPVKPGGPSALPGAGLIQAELEE
jgi:hypothetical protein